MRRTQPNWMWRLRRAATPAGKALAVTATTAATAFGIASGFGITLPLTMIYWVAGLCVAPSVGVFIWKTRSPHLPAVIIDEDNTNGIVRGSLCSGADLPRIKRCAKAYLRPQ